MLQRNSTVLPSGISKSVLDTPAYRSCKEALIDAPTITHSFLRGTDPSSALSQYLHCIHINEGSLHLPVGEPREWRTQATYQQSKCTTGNRRDRRTNGSCPATIQETNKKREIIARSNLNRILTQVGAVSGTAGLDGMHIACGGLITYTQVLKWTDRGGWSRNDALEMSGRVPMLN